MKTSRWCATGWLLFLGALALGGWQATRAAEVAGEARVADSLATAHEEARDQAEAEVERWRERYEAEREARQKVADSLRRVEAAADEAGVQAGGDEARASVEIEANLHRIKRLAPPPLVPLADSALVQLQRLKVADDREDAAHARQVNALRGQVALLQADTAALHFGIRQMENRYQALLAENQSLRAARDRWRKAAQPGFFAGLWRNAPKLAGAFTSGILIDRLFFAPQQRR